MTPDSSIAQEGVRCLPRAVRRRKFGIRVFAAVVFAVCVLEFAGRVLGLQHPVIYEKTTYGYRVVPNQNLHRFGNRSFYNEQGLRSEPMALSVTPRTLRVLCLGDSVTNGGAITDQAATFPYQLQLLLRPHFDAVEVLNASAPGWAIANELGWLRENGIFDSRFVVLTLSTHDLFQPMAPSTTVGKHPSFPGERPLLALQDVVQQYILPWLDRNIRTADPGVADPGIFRTGEVDAAGPEARWTWNLDDILVIEKFVRRQGGRLIVLYLDEAGMENMAERIKSAKRQLFEILAAQKVDVLTLEPEIRRFGHGALFRDSVHPNPSGNREIAAVIARHITNRVTGSTTPYKRVLTESQ